MKKDHDIGAPVFTDRTDVPTGKPESRGHEMAKSLVGTLLASAVPALVRLFPSPMMWTAGGFAVSRLLLQTGRDFPVISLIASSRWWSFVFVLTTTSLCLCVGVCTGILSAADHLVTHGGALRKPVQATLGRMLPSSVAVGDASFIVRSVERAYNGFFAKLGALGMLGRYLVTYFIPDPAKLLHKVGEEIEKARSSNNNANPADIVAGVLDAIVHERICKYRSTVVAVGMSVVALAGGLVGLLAMSRK